MARLFVYGSLKRGCENAGLLEGAAYLGQRTTAEGYALVSYIDGFPALFREQVGRGQVTGELYVVGEALLVELDAFEDCPTLYQRRAIDLADDEEAFAYVIAAEEASRFSLVPSGTWSG